MRFKVVSSTGHADENGIFSVTLAAPAGYVILSSGYHTKSGTVEDNVPLSDTAGNIATDAVAAWLFNGVDGEPDSPYACYIVCMSLLDS